MFTMLGKRFYSEAFPQKFEKRKLPKLNPEEREKYIEKAGRFASLLGSGVNLSDIFQASVFLFRNRLVLSQLARHNSNKTFYVKKGTSKLSFSAIIWSKNEDHFKPFLILKSIVLGTGGYKIVYKGLDLYEEKFVAISDCRNFEKNQKLTEKEFQWQLQFNEAIVKCVYLKSKDLKNQMKVVMPLANRGSLFEFSRVIHQYPLQNIQQILDGLLGCIEKIHRLKIVLCDIKPRNILLHFEDFRFTVRFNDFGLSFIEGTKKYQNTTIGFEAPEQRAISSEPVTRKTDVYQLALVIWQVFIDYGEKFKFVTAKKYKEFWIQKKRQYSVLDSLQNILLDMLHPNPKKRPSLKEIIKLKPQISKIQFIK